MLGSRAVFDFAVREVAIESRRVAGPVRVVRGTHQGETVTLVAPASSNTTTEAVLEALLHANPEVKVVVFVEKTRSTPAILTDRKVVHDEKSTDQLTQLMEASGVNLGHKSRSVIRPLSRAKHAATVAIKVPDEVALATALSVLDVVVA